MLKLYANVTGVQFFDSHCIVEVTYRVNAVLVERNIEPISLFLEIRSL